MQTQTLAMDWIFQPAKWQPLRWVAEWLREQSARQRERRQAPRRRVANLAANYLDGTGAARHVVRDVSTSGAFIFADFKWPPGTIVRMTLQLEGHPFPAATLVRTKVVRCAPAGLGVQFLPVKKAERRSLANFLKSIPKSRPFTVGLYPEEGLGEISALEAVRQEAVYECGRSHAAERVGRTAAGTLWRSVSFCAACCRGHSPSSGTRHVRHQTPRVGDC